MRRAEDFYTEVSEIIKNGKSEIYRTCEHYNFRNPTGIQAVIRYADTGDRAIVVYHCFKNPADLTFKLKGNWKAVKTLYDAKIAVSDSITIAETKEVFGNVILLQKV